MAKDLDLALPFDHLLDIAVRFCKRFLAKFEITRGLASDAFDQNEHEHEHYEHDQRQHRGEQQHHRNYADHRDETRDKLRDALAQHFAERVRII